MSTQLLRIQGDNGHALLVTRFYGGQGKGTLLRVNVFEPFGIDGVVVLDAAAAMQLRDALDTYIRDAAGAARPFWGQGVK